MGEKGDMGCAETLREVERYVDGECSGSSRSR